MLGAAVSQSSPYVGKPGETGGNRGQTGLPPIPLRSSARFPHSSFIMARFARVVAIDAPHHITQRGNARQTVFEGDADRLVYLDLLRQHCRLGRRLAGESACPTKWLGAGLAVEQGLKPGFFGTVRHG